MSPPSNYVVIPINSYGRSLSPYWREKTRKISQGLGSWVTGLRRRNCDVGCPESKFRAKLRHFRYQRRPLNKIFISSIFYPFFLINVIRAVGNSAVQQSSLNFVAVVYGSYFASHFFTSSKVAVRFIIYHLLGNSVIAAFYLSYSYKRATRSRCLCLLYLWLSLNTFTVSLFIDYKLMSTMREKWHSSRISTIFAFYALTLCF